MQNLQLAADSINSSINSSLTAAQEELFNFQLIAYVPTVD